MTENKKVAIVGGGKSSIHAPYDDKTFDKWGVNDWFVSLPYQDFTAWFEMHEDKELLNINGRFKINRMEELNKLDMPIYMKYVRANIPNSIEFPLNKILEKYPGYFCNTIAYMIVFAIEAGYKKIHLYGVDLHTLHIENIDIACCISYWLGRADGLGIETYVHEDSILHKKKKLYGWSD